MSSDDTPSLLRPEFDEDHVLGIESAEMTLVEYGDFQCPICHQAYPAVKLQLAHFGDRVRFVFRHYPMQEVHPFAQLAAEASEAAAKQGKFWEFHDRIFSARLSTRASDILDVATRLNLDLDRFQAELYAHAYQQRVRKDMEQAKALGVRSTPTFYLNGQLLDVSFGMGQLRRALDTVLLRKKGA